jgi:Flp pilus assembly protein TadG
MIKLKKTDNRGQSLVETALMLPFLLFLVLNAVNFGYFFLMMINLTGASRTAGIYTVMGSSTPVASALPPSGPSTNLLSVTYLTQQDLTGAVGNPTSPAVQVCSPININGSGSGVNGSGTSQKSNCMTCTGTSCAAVGTGSPAPDTDPENTATTTPFVLSRVDINYTFTPLIPGSVFNIPLLAAPICTSSGGNVTCTFHRMVEMRSMN